ncbi:protein of unknown function [Pedobacter steynii]|uniref:DUF4835 domain-containing protein n=1 Tax=Pedobacter steynii TaxID=430522 RepID=A0A1H0ILS5_9SPHI|nr:DUF4835 family protein [Pedobacter steynii]NQX42945.1 DUF4835 family protein [Pedobacter steynii]SDO32387.1 protein of unknown function [Pedobacter steynii]
MKQRLFLFVLSFFLCHTYIHAQELNARVTVMAPTVPNINKRNIEVLQTTIREFLNNNKWTNETYTPQERIETNFVITVTAWDGSSGYKAEAQIQSSRPVYGTAYNSTILNISDKDFDFNYNEGQSLDYSDQNFISNLSSLLGFYANTIIGLDKDSFSNLGGTPFYNKAQNILNLAQQSGNKGWKASDGLRNRYWLNENLLNKSFEDLREFIYSYHYNGMDRLQEDKDKGSKKIISLLSGLTKMDRQKLGSIFPNVYFATKADEIVNLLSIGNPQERLKAYNLLADIDPANINKYESLKPAKQGL